LQKNKEAIERESWPYKAKNRGYITGGCMRKRGRKKPKLILIGDGS